MKPIIFDNSFKILKKHLTQTIAIIFLATICFYILGVSSNTSNAGEEAANEYQETYGNKSLYYTGETLSDPMYYSYLDQSNDILFKKLSAFINTLYNTDKFSFFTLSNQSLQIVDQKIAEQFLYGYENGYASDSIVDFNGETLYSVKSIQVSEKFFDEFSIRISSGKCFNSQDYIIKANHPIPALLGGSYKDTFKLGETFKAYYMAQKLDFYVIGFLDDNSFFYDKTSNDMSSLERYIITPAFIADYDNNFARAALLDRTNGFINSSLGFDETYNIFNKYLDNAGIGNYEIYMINPEDIGKINILDTYSAMTNEVSKQFKIMVLLVAILSLIANIIVICNMLRDNFQSFCVEQLCGASNNDLLLESLITVLILMLISDFSACASLLLFRYRINALKIVQISAFIISLISCFICGIYTKKIKLSTYLGGKE